MTTQNLIDLMGHPGDVPRDSTRKPRDNASELA
jgi:hypothetical protein